MQGAAGDISFLLAGTGHSSPGSKKWSLGECPYIVWTSGVKGLVAAFSGTMASCNTE